MVTIPVVLKDLIDKANAAGSDGLLGIVQHYALFDRAGTLAGSAEFLSKFEALVTEHEPKESPKARKRNLRQWMQEVLAAFLGFPVEVPPPPRLNRAQSRALKRYHIRLFFVPAIVEARYPAHIVRLAWDKYLTEGQFQRIPLPGRWVAFDTTRKPDYTERVYPNDRLIFDLGRESRFAHPHSGKGEGDDIVEDLMPKIAGLLRFAPEQVGLASAEAWHFLASLMNFIRENFGEDLPDLGSTVSVEWVANSLGSGHALIVGNVGRGGLAYVDHGWRVSRYDGCGFRPLVMF